MEEDESERRKSFLIPSQTSENFLLARSVDRSSSTTFIYFLTISSLATNYWRWQNVSQPPRKELLSPAIAHAQEGYVDSIQDPFTVLH